MYKRSTGTGEVTGEGLDGRGQQERREGKWWSICKMNKNANYVFKKNLLGQRAGSATRRVYPKARLLVP